MSLIDILEQLGLPGVLRQIETQARTGLLIVKQGMHWVELYFRQGRLMCIGPIRTNATLGERLLHAGIISEQAWQATQQAIGAEPLTEIHIALTLMNLGFIGHETLRTWATQRASEVIQAILYWTQVQVRFEEEVMPPDDRLLVAVAVSTLLPVPSTPLRPATTPTPQTDAFKGPEPIATIADTHTIQDVSHRITPLPTRVRAEMDAHNSYSSDISNVPTLLDPSQFLDETPAPVLHTPHTLHVSHTPRLQKTESSLPALPALPTIPSSKKEQETNSLSSLISDESENFLSLFDVEEKPVQVPAAPLLSVAGRWVDISKMHPEMILVEADIMALMDQHVDIQITPEQWCVLTRVDGQTSLRKACQELMMTREQICQVVGELILLGLVRLVPPGQVPVHELSPVTHHNVTSGQLVQGPQAGFMTSGPILALPPQISTPLPSGIQSALPAPQMLSTPPTADVMQQIAPSVGFETYSQWGNGGNRATFIPGRGWVASPQPLQPIQSSGPIIAQQVQHR